MSSFLNICISFNFIGINLKEQNRIQEGKKAKTTTQEMSIQSIQASLVALEREFETLKQEANVLLSTNRVIIPLSSTTNAISLFSGAGGDTLGLEKAGYTVIAFNEFNDAAKQTHKVMFPHSEDIVDSKTKASDILKVPDAEFEKHKSKVNLIFAGFPCFVEGTLVLTANGYKPIETVTLDDTLLTHTGTFQPIVNLQKKTYSGTLMDIRVKYHPINITATEEHPFYVRERVKTWNNEIRQYQYSFKPAEWKTADELTTEDFCGMAVNTKSNIPTFEFEHRVNKSRVDKLTKTLDNPDEWFMMGYFMGDGWIQETLKKTGHSMNVIRFAFHNQDTATIERIQRVLPITNKLCSTGQCDKYGCADRVWFTIFKMFGKYAHGKKIPEWIQDAPVHLIKEFMDGYFAADGCYNKTMTSITTVSYNLAFGLQRLYLKLGRIASIQKSIRPKTYVIQGRTVNQRDTYQIRVTIDDPKRKPSAFIEGAYAWMPIHTIQQRQTDTLFVYNFEVQTDNSYVVENTIVHNCQSFSHAGKKNPHDKRGELVHQFVRATRIIQPEWIMGENVKGLLARKGQRTPESPFRPVIDIIREIFHEIGYELTYKVIDATEVGVPQKRKRLIIVGHRGSLFPHVPWDSLRSNNHNNRPAIRPFLESHLQDAMLLPALYRPSEQSPHYWIATTETVASGTPHKNLDRLVRGIRNKSSQEKAAEAKTNSVSETNQIIEPNGLISFGVRKGGYHGMIVDPDQPCSTIISTYNLCPRLFVGLYNASTRVYWIRCMTSKELGQIQGFPATYRWQGTEKQKIIQIGNAVPPPLAERVGMLIRTNRVELKDVRQETEAVAVAVEDNEEDEDEE